jgi:uncharacterized protein YjdB
MWQKSRRSVHGNLRKCWQIGNFHSGEICGSVTGRRANVIICIVTVNGLAKNICIVTVNGLAKNVVRLAISGLKILVRAFSVAKREKWSKTASLLYLSS